jgi:hypothetical protein
LSVQLSGSEGDAALPELLTTLKQSLDENEIAAVKVELDGQAYAMEGLSQDVAWASWPAADVSFPGVRCSTSAAAMIEFDLNGRKRMLDEQTVRKLRERALAGAGSSSTLNDLAVILTRALSEPKQVTLRRAESRALERLLEAPSWSPWITSPRFGRGRT